MTDNLWAKSKPQISLKQHLLDTETAAQFIFRDRILKNWLRFFKVATDDQNRFQLLLSIASLGHDLGKANPEFQAILRPGSDLKQTFRHEHLGGLLFHFPSVIQWLSPAELGEKKFDRLLVTAAIVGHHLKTGPKWFEPLQNNKQELLLNLDSDQVNAIFKRIAQHLDLSDPLPSLPASWKRQDQEWQSAKESAKEASGKGRNSFWNSIRVGTPNSQRDKRRALHLALKAGLIAADTAASGLVREGKDISEWIQLKLHRPAIQPEDIETDILQPRYEKLAAEAKERGEIFSVKPFQLKAENLGDRVLLQAGCGQGKTLAAYLWAKGVARRREIGRVIFLYPTRATATEGFREYIAAAPEQDAGMIHGTSEYELEKLRKKQEEELRLNQVHEFDMVSDDPNLCLAAKNYQPDPRLYGVGLWEKRYFSSTVDRFLAFLSFDYGSTVLLPLLADSAIILDEIHAYSRHMFDQAMAFLKEFDVPVLCMTATLSNTRRQEIEDVEGFELYPNQDRDCQEVDELRESEEKERYCIEFNNYEEARKDAINSYLAGERVLWVVNTVDRCQEEAQKLDKEQGISGSVLCYHSRFRLMDRQKRHEEVIEAFQQEGKAAIAVTTQVCEMSLDLDADVLITELAPCSSLVQRFGRSNRKGKRNYSKIRVYEPKIYELKIYRPYTESLILSAKRFLSEIIGSQSQKALAEKLEIYELKEAENSGKAPFLTSGYYADSQENDFRDIEEWTRDSICDEDLSQVLKAIQEKRSWAAYVVPV
ncbi:MAG: CRISPR-associated helicase Cas3', partial [Pseudomonadota bacterium]